MELRNHSKQGEQHDQICKFVQGESGGQISWLGSWVDKDFDLDLVPSDDKPLLPTQEGGTFHN